MQKKDMLPILYRSAALFEENLAGRTFLFIAQGTDRNAPHLLEARFERRHFLHFTGCKPVVALPAEAFLDLCLTKHLGPDDFSVVPQTVLKLEVLESLMRLPYTVKMLGDFSGSGDFLYTEKLAGHVRGCMGFVLGDTAPLYSPNTVLKADLRSLPAQPHKLLCVYAKRSAQTLYPAAPVFIAKELRGKTLVWPEMVSAKLEPVIL